MWLLDLQWEEVVSRVCLMLGWLDLFAQGLQWVLLKEEEIIPRILAMEGRRGRPPSSEHLQQQQQQSPGEGSQGRRRKGRPPNVGASDFPSPSEAKLLRKLEAQGGFAQLPHTCQHLCAHSNYRRDCSLSRASQLRCCLPLCWGSWWVQVQFFKCREFSWPLPAPQ